MRIGVLSGSSLDSFQQAVLNNIFEEASLEVVCAMIDARTKPSLKQRFLKNLRRGRGGYMMIMAFRRYLRPKETTVSAIDFFESHKVACYSTTMPYESSSVDILTSHSLDVMILIGGYGIVREPLLSLTPMGVLSYHHGDMRKYRGQPVGFWEMYNGDDEMGVTIQRLSAGLDKGLPIVERKVDILPSDTVDSLRKRAMDNSVDMMREALCRVSLPDFTPTPITEWGKVYTLPNLRQYLRLKIRLLCRR